MCAPPRSIVSRGTERTFLASFCSVRDRLFGIDDSLDELQRLSETAGLVVMGRTSQRSSAMDSRTLVGSGKVQEILQECAAMDVDTIVFDCELTPRQGRCAAAVVAFGGACCPRDPPWASLQPSRTPSRHIFSARSPFGPCPVPHELAKMHCMYQQHREARLRAPRRRQGPRVRPHVAHPRHLRPAGAESGGEVAGVSRSGGVPAAQASEPPSASVSSPGVLALCARRALRVRGFGG